MPRKFFHAPFDRRATQARPRPTNDCTERVLSARLRAREARRSRRSHGDLRKCDLSHFKVHLTAHQLYEVGKGQKEGVGGTVD